MQSVHGRSERKLIVLNELHQPIGPTEAIVKELGSFLGTLARNGTFCPLNVFKWKKLKTHDDMWNYTMEKYDIPKVAKEWALRTIQLAWRKYKNGLKKKHYYRYANDEIRMAKRPKEVSNLNLRLSSNIGTPMRLKKNTENRKKLRYPHTVGKTSFAIIREENPEALSSKEFFVATRRRKPGRVYKDSYEDTASKIAEMERIETQESEDGSQSVDAYVSVMGPDHPGRVRLYGRGVTKTLLKRESGGSGLSSNVTDEMEKKMEEIEERMQQRMQEKFNAQKDTMEQDITMKVIAKIQQLNPEFRLDPNMLRFSVRSPGEASSTPGNNQGVENEEREGDNEHVDLT
ncbi:uncharacterized protein LOC132054881 isoform X2 [Lycium ferocissimum]|uniref:uncharacterized protein LOC132054881 isoform X2 n=1 Tax=Lycium ferocissimum TaxID=112874 RepID=UPI0028159909|nr:uncharacterized protein LOC132054881 isoform X2 [Lycium ferocissimum]